VIFEWDARKASANVRKHRVTFEQAATVFNDPAALTFADPDHSDEEFREITIGHTSQGRLLFVSHCERAGRMRIIGARPASRAERKQYEEGIEPKTDW
jgi:uncharacterized DUF497 family protein